MATTYGQRIVRSDGSTTTVTGMPSSDAALWAAVRLSNMTKRQIRKALTQRQRKQLVATARRKLSLSAGDFRT